MIKFGTSGWRAIIGDEFTFANLRVVTHAIGQVLGESGLDGRGIVVGYDTRFLSERFALEAARVLAAQGIRCVMSDTAIPTPAVAHAIRHHGFGGAINITASHNPAEYNGLKFSTERGAPSPPDLTRRIEQKAAALGAVPPPPAAVVETCGFLQPYIAQIETLVRFETIRTAGTRLVVDPRWGAARGFADAILAKHGIPFHLLHDERDVTYGGGGPDVSARNLADLGAAVKSGGHTLGIAFDGDADRFGVVDADGRWVNPNLVIALLADYLAETRGWRQGLGRTYATTGLVDAVARHYGVPLYQTPVGFKYLGEQILENKVFLAGEESAGLSVTGHVPEKDGILAGLLAAEMVAARGRSISQLREDLFAKVGALYSAREDFAVAPDQTARLRAAMAAPPGMLGARKVARTTVLDGLRLDFEDGGWLLMRPSGTEPVVRCYAEAPTEADLADLMRTGKAELTGGVS